ncbi:MAG: hypothetical protein H6719_37790 [Sandaracinaceae bacterium]|nr:hypothetical protein [Sandaracinaceae bacterium]
MQLIACEGCARHVHADEGSCPFCGADVDAPTESPRQAPVGRLGRTAVFLFGAAIGGCGSVTPAYGVPPSDGGVAVDSGPEATDAGFDAGLLAMYGGPPVDAGSDAGGPAPAYGAVPSDAGIDDAG